MGFKKYNISFVPFQTIFAGMFLGTVLCFIPVSGYAFDENWVSCLGQNECHKCAENPAWQNPWGYTGFYQFGVNYAAEAICTSASRQKIPLMNNVQNWDVMKQHCVLTEWAKSQGITSHDDWMSGGSPPNAARAQQLQQAMLLKKSEALWTTIQNQYGSYIGQNIGGVTMTKETMVAMAHLKGMGGLAKTLAGEDVRDGLGTSTTGYAGCLAGCLQNDGVRGNCDLSVPDICSEPPANAAP